MTTAWIWDMTALNGYREGARASVEDARGAPPALTALKQRADGALAFEPVSVMDKSMTPPSGDKHDYMSVGPYWWPDPEQPDGLPYIRRDGEVNPERHTYDNVPLSHLCDQVVQLAQAAYVFEHAPYARHAARLLRVWFLDPASRMNPHLDYGQAIPGRCTGRGIGIIDTATRFPDLVDALQLLAGAADWSEADQEGMRAWMWAYLEWLLESEKGRDEAATHNNHAVYFDLQAVVLALYTGQAALARRILAEVPARRIETQIEPDGCQPHELARTKSRSYSLMNTLGFLRLARLGRHVDVDLWGYVGDEGRSIPRAVQWFIPYIRGEKRWTWQQIAPFEDPAAYRPMFLLAAAHAAEPVYRDILDDLPSASPLVTLSQYDST